MENKKVYYFVLSLSYCLLNSSSHASTIMEEWGNTQENFQHCPRSSTSDKLNSQIEDIDLKRQKESYLDVSSERNVPLLRFSYPSKNYLSYHKDSPLKDFIKEVKDFYTTNNPKEVSIDFSDHFFSITEFEDIYNDLQKEKIKVDSFNLSRTGIDSNITEVIKDLLKEDFFKYVNISETPASEDKETFKNLDSKQISKIIFIAPEHLDIVKNNNIVAPEVILNHQNYYKMRS